MNYRTGVLSHLFDELSSVKEFTAAVNDLLPLFRLRTENNLSYFIYASFFVHLNFGFEKMCKNLLNVPDYHKNIRIFL